MVGRIAVLLTLLFADCALIDAARGPVEPACVFLSCDCGQTLCNPEDCDAEDDCVQCNENGDCEDTCNFASGRCNSCPVYILTAGTTLENVDGEVFYCEADSASPAVCLRASCYPDY